MELKRIVICLTLLLGAISAKAANHAVNIINSSFSPANLTINVGDTVTWTERDGLFHTSTSDNGVWDSGGIARNQSFSFTFNSPGTFPYHCTPHPHMTGTIVVQAAANTPPSVTITNPVNNATFPEPANIEIQASATDSDGIQSVEFYDGATLLETDTTNPYSTLAELAAGSHALTAVGVDGFGARGTSAVVNVTVSSAPNTPPTVNILFPTNNTVYAGPTNITIQANANDSDGIMHVEFFNGSTSLGMAGSMPFTVDASLAIGNHALTAVAMDHLGATATSSVVNVTVEAAPNSPPSISITNPVSGAVFSGPADILVEADASDSDGIMHVEFFNGATSLGMDMASPYSVVASLSLGDHALTAVAMDQGGAMATSAVVNVTVQENANIPPIVSIVNPTNETVFPNGTNIVIEATASDEDGIMHVEFFNGISSLGMAATEPFRVTVTLPAGSSSLTAVAMDNAGLSSTSSVVNVRVESVRIENAIAERIPKGDITIELQTIVDGLASPLGIGVPNDNSGRILVYDQAGKIWVIGSNGKKLAEPMLDVRTSLVTLGNYDERGLLGMAVHPDFSDNPFIYTYTSEPNGPAADFPVTMPEGETNNHQSVVTEWRISSTDTNKIDPDSRREIMRLDQPQGNHNGGTIRFGPDGYLYIALGDGGASDDQASGHLFGGNAQSLETVLGKFLRIDVNGRTSANGQYSVPSDNPFVGTNGIDEIYAYGLRHPFSFSFDRQDGTLYVADVGQNQIEEIDILVSGGNYGWNIKEGTFYFDPNGSGPGFVTTAPVVPEPPGLIDPIAQYDHDDGFAVLAGSVYRGSSIPELQGRFVFGDWGSFGEPSGRLFYLDANSEIKELRIGLDDRKLGFWIKGFGEDANGEIYACIVRSLGPNGDSGRIVKLIPAPAQVRLSSAQASGTNFTIGWENGLGPFAIQKKDAVNDPICQNVDVSASNSITVPQVSMSSFFRLKDAHSQYRVPFTAIINGANERPNPITTDGSGTGTFALEDSTLRFEIRYENLSSATIAAHIHGPATAAESATVMIDLAPFHNGPYGASNGFFSGAVMLTPVQKAHLMAGRTYVNIHTMNNGGGEIRGQIAPVLYQASLNGLNERPTPVTNSPGFGSGVFVLVGNQLTFNLTYHNLTGPASMAHIHGPATASGRAGIMIDFEPFKGAGYGVSGSIAGTVPLTSAQLEAFLNGLTYANIHTTANPGGEIRGQILPQATAIPMTVLLSGANERANPVSTPATGSGTFALEGDRLSFDIEYTGLSAPAIAAHIHGPGTAAQAVGIMIDLAPYNGRGFGQTNGTLSGSVSLTHEQKEAMLQGLTYVNVHSSAHTPGEIRGQIAPVLMSTALSGSAERPSAVRTLGNGSAIFTVVRDQLTFNMSYRELTSAAVAAHIHGPATTQQSTNVLINFAPFNGGAFGIAGSFAGSTNLTPANFSALVDGLTYVNVHTPTNAPGEIRGQITR